MARAKLATLLTLRKSNLNNALSGGDNDTIFLQAAVYPHNIDLDQGKQVIARVTRSNARGQIILPYTYANGTLAYLGDDEIGYPPNLFPNFTFGEQLSDETHVMYDNKKLTSDSTLLLGPLFLHNNLTLISMTLAINSKYPKPLDPGLFTQASIVASCVCTSYTPLSAAQC